MIDKKDYESITFNETPLKISHYTDPEIASQQSILYFHGGGLIYGERNDLPEEYIQVFTRAGYDFITMDYPLAPESNLDEILKVCVEQVVWFQNKGIEVLDLEHSDFILFGRSAGAYIALWVAHHLDNKPKGIISLYGYYKLTDASFTVPSQHYLQFARVSESAARALTKEEPAVSFKRNQRYPIYLYARQTGNWMGILTDGDRDMAKEFSLTQENLTELPPTFLAHAEHDPDVPSRQSKMMAQHIPAATLKTFNLEEHDFDRTHPDSYGASLYDDILAWLGTL